MACLFDLLCVYFILMLGFVTVADCASASLKSIPTGTWGGGHIRMTVSNSGALIEYDCAHGTIDGRLLTDEDGNFEAIGTHIFERGGPLQSEDQSVKRHLALYRGWTDGNQMQLNVTLLKTKENVGYFSLGLEHPAYIDKCL